MKKPPATRRQTERFVKISDLRFPMELRLVFARPVSIAEARQTARRLLERVQIEAEGFLAPDELETATARCASLQRSAALYDRDTING
ncbi:MAG: hypothetical protein KIS66_03615 [Fimbriimonadaceae bacterium]|nr:hypothetical protein [Fimbriimonadaceae bacterium]